MNQKKVLLLSIGAVALLAGILITLLFFGFNQDNSEDQTYTILSESSQPKSVQVTNQDGVFTMTENGENASGETNWIINEFPDVPLSNTYCQQLANMTQNLSATKLFDAQEDLSSYGLDQPQATVVAEFDKNSVTISIGDQNPSMTGYYCQVSDNPQIALVSNANIAPFLRGSYGYVDRTLIPYTSTDNEESASSQVQSCTITRSDLPEPVTAQRGEDGNLQITSPEGCSMDAETQTLMENAPFSLVAKNTVSVYPTQEQLTSFGLTEPQATVSYEIAGTSYTLQIGNSASTSQNAGDDSTSTTYYVMLEGRPVVYTLSINSLPWLTMSFTQG